MGTPFYQSKKFINRLAVAIGILAVVIFVAANLLSIHAYNIHPTPTQTPTSTATVTNTPRPTSTPTITPTFKPEFGNLPALIADMTVRGFQCTVDQPAEGGLEFICEKGLEETSLQYRLTMLAEIPFDQQILLEPFTVPVAETVLSELTWLAQIPFRYPWLPAYQPPYAPESSITPSGSQPAPVSSVTPSTVPSETPTVTPTTTPEITVTNTPLGSPPAAPVISPAPEVLLLDQIAVWIADNQSVLAAGQTFNQIFDGLEYSLTLEEGNLVIRAVPAAP